MIIGIGYKCRVGKDSVGSLLSEMSGWPVLRFADELKNRLMRNTKWTPQNKNETVGSLRFRDKYFDTMVGRDEVPEDVTALQWFGVHMRKCFGEDFWIRCLMDTNFLPSSQNAIIPDVRFPNEYRWVRGQGYTIRVDRADAPVDRNRSHVSETALVGQPFDFVVTNTGLDSLPVQCAEIWASLQILQKKG